MNDNRRLVWQIGALLLVVSILLLGYFLQTELQINGGVIGAPLDDAWIHFQFARNLSQGQGFSFNPGEPTPGSTAPLWTLLLAGVGQFTTDFMRPAIGLSVIFFLASVLLAYGFSAWMTRSLWPGVLAGLAVAFCGRFLWAGLAGMETTAFAALSLAAIWVYSRQGLGLFPALLFGLASLLRPEGHALFALAIGDSFASWIRIVQREGAFSWSEAAQRFLPPLALYALLALPYILFSLSTTGRPLPNTFYAKVGSEHFLSGRTLRETLAWHWQDNPVSILLLLVGLWPAWRRSRLAVLWLLALPLLTAMLIDQTWHFGRYTMPLIPLQMVIAATGAWWLVRRVGQARGESDTVRYAAAASLVLLLLLGGAWRLPHWATMLGTNTREIEQIDVALGRWLAANTPPDALIAVDDIGAITFISGRRIVDMNGLVSTEVWPALDAPDQLTRDRRLARILSASNPDYMAAFPLWRWNIATNADVAMPVYHASTDTHTIIFQQDAYVYDMSWPYVTAAQPAVAMDATFGETVGLLGYDLSGGEETGLMLYWQSLVPTAVDYDIFVHLLNGAGEIVAQVDRQPLSGLAPTSFWQPGDIVRDPYTIPVPSDLPPGDYQIQVGLFDRQTGARLPYTRPPEHGDALPLTFVTIP
ncbi:MAG: hypothetical protein ACK2UK_15605 [Candidatus Promineifilaceae bacterium]